MNRNQWISYLTLLVLLVTPRVVAAQQVSFSQVSIFIKEDGEGKVIIDTRPNSQLEPLKALNPEKTVSLPFFGSADVAKFDEVRYHLRYDFSRFRSLSELKHSAMNEDGLKIWPTLKIDPEENALVFTPEPALQKTRLWFPLRVQGNIALRANLIGVGNGRLSFGFFQGNGDSEVILVTIHGADSPEVIDNPDTPRGEPAGTVTVHQKQGEKALESKGKIRLAANDRQEMNFQLTNGLTKKNNMILDYGGVLPIGVSSMDIIAQFPASFGIGLDQKGSAILVNRLIKGGSGEAAGMKVGDELKAINGKKPTNLDDAMQLLGESDLERGAKVEIARLGKTRTLQLQPIGVQRDASSGLQFEGWEIYDMQSRGDFAKKNIQFISKDEIEFNAGMQEICILSKQSFGSGALKLEFQTDGNGGMIGVGATVKNRNGKDFFDRYPFCIETKLSSPIGLLVMPRQDFRFELAADQSFDSKDRRKVLPLVKTQIDSGTWNSLECRFQGNDYLVSINGNIVNRLNAAEPIRGKIMIWPGTAKFKIRNSTFASEHGEYKLGFDSLK
jgi:hypothetical protein